MRLEAFLQVIYFYLAIGSADCNIPRRWINRELEGQRAHHAESLEVFWLPLYCSLRFLRQAISFDNVVLCRGDEDFLIGRDGERDHILVLLTKRAQDSSRVNLNQTDLLVLQAETMLSVFEQDEGTAGVSRPVLLLQFEMAR